MSTEDIFYMWRDVENKVRGISSYFQNDFDLMLLKNDVTIQDLKESFPNIEKDAGSLLELLHEAISTTRKFLIQKSSEWDSRGVQIDVWEGLLR